MTQQSENIHLQETATCYISTEQRYLHTQAGEGLQDENCLVCRAGWEPWIWTFTHAHKVIIWPRGFRTWFSRHGGIEL